jgi:S-DNA-T family DNA segregation ATPase FtsK/SpoIIIE
LALFSKFFYHRGQAVIQARRNRKITPEHRRLTTTGWRELLFIGFCFAAVYLVVSLATYNPLDPAWSSAAGESREVTNKGGVAGAMFADIFFYLFGYFAYLFALMVPHLGWLIYQGKYHDLLAEPKHLIGPGIGFVLTLSAGCGLAIVHFTAESALLPSHAGGILGTLIGKSLEKMLSQLGATLALLALFFTGVTMLTGLSWLRLMDFLGYHTLRLLPIWRRYLAKVVFPWLAKYLGMALAWAWQSSRSAYSASSDALSQRRAAAATSKTAAPPDEEAEEEVPTLPPSLITKPSPLPSPQRLDTPAAEAPQAAKKLEQRLREVLQQTNSGAELKSAQSGPVLTRVEIQPPKEQAAAQIILLAEQIAQSIGIAGIRVAETGPGLIALEIPNPQAEPVYLSGLINTPGFTGADSPLTVALGRDVTGQPVIVDIARMPHLLMAGNDSAEVDSTLHGLILSLLYKASPDAARFVFISLNGGALAAYGQLPHLLAPVITQPSQATIGLRWCVSEMERRYRLMADLGVRNIDGYNRKVRESVGKDRSGNIPLDLAPIPYIVLLVQEIADLNLSGNKPAEEAITRLAQKARAAGIHMVLATRQPVASVLTNLLRANFPTRIALKVAGKTESRNILGQQGAEHLLGNGDMLYLTPGTGVPARVHGVRVSEREVGSVLQDVKKQNAPGYADMSAEL